MPTRNAEYYVDKSITDSQKEDNMLQINARVYKLIHEDHTVVQVRLHLFLPLSTKGSE
jgi:hypothetical protein